MTCWYGLSFTLLKAESVGARLKLVLLAVLAIVSPAGAGPAAPQQPPAAAKDSSDQVASQLLQRLGLALKGHSQKTVLAVFDFPQMTRGMLFREQITNFLF